MYNKYSPICVGSSIYIVTKVLSVIMHWLYEVEPPYDENQRITQFPLNRT